MSFRRETLGAAFAILLGVSGWAGCGAVGEEAVREILGEARAPGHATPADQEPARRPLAGDRRVPLIPKNDVQFIDFFVPHHRTAIELANIEIQRGARADIKDMAAMMKEEQLAEIAMMRAARKALTGSADSPIPPSDWHLLFDRVAMHTAKGSDVDRMFLEHMIPHHASGVPVADRALGRLARQDMNELAEQIYDSQARQIGEMKALLGDSCPATGGPIDCHNVAGDPTIIGDKRIAYTPAEDVRFIDFFVTHHRDAIMMAEMVIERGVNEDVKEIARQIRTAQLEEVGRMIAARRELTGNPEPPPPPQDPHMQMEMAEMMQLDGLPLDRHFVMGMIPHHAGGLPPTHRGRPRLKRMDLRQIARNIYDSQAREIGELHAILEKLE